MAGQHGAAREHQKGDASTRRQEAAKIRGPAGVRSRARTNKAAAASLPQGAPVSGQEPAKGCAYPLLLLLLLLLPPPAPAFTSRSRAHACCASPPASSLLTGTNIRSASARRREDKTSVWRQRVPAQPHLTLQRQPGSTAAHHPSPSAASLPLTHHHLIFFISHGVTSLGLRARQAARQRTPGAHTQHPRPHARLASLLFLVQPLLRHATRQAAVRWHATVPPPHLKLFGCMPPALQSV